MDKNLFWVMLGGALGSPARYLLGGWAQKRFGAAFPFGTLIINLTGCLILGIFVGLRSEGRYLLPSFLTPAFAIGFVGAYTTFSTFEVESATLLQQGSLSITLAYMGASVIAGLLLALAGIAVGRSL